MKTASDKIKPFQHFGRLKSFHETSTFLTCVGRQKVQDVVLFTFQLFFNNSSRKAVSLLKPCSTNFYQCGIMNDFPVIGDPCFAHRILGSPGGTHCESLQRNVWRGVVSPFKAVSLDREHCFQESKSCAANPIVGDCWRLLESQGHSSVVSACLPFRSHFSRLMTSPLARVPPNLLRKTRDCSKSSAWLKHPGTSNFTCFPFV